MRLALARPGAKVQLGALGPGFPRLQLIWADQGYAGALRQWTKDHLDVELEVVYPWWRQITCSLPDFLDAVGFAPGFHVLPRRWFVERTVAWLGRSRCLSRDYERLPISSLEISSPRMSLIGRIWSPTPVALVVC